MPIVKPTVSVDACIQSCLAALYDVELPRPGMIDDERVEMLTSLFRAKIHLHAAAKLANRHSPA
jgi:hypothetical protein